MKVEQLESDLDHWRLYLYAMKSPVTRDKYQKRLGKFFDFLRLEGSTIEDKSKVFVEMARKDSNRTYLLIKLNKTIPEANTDGCYTYTRSEMTARISDLISLYSLNRTVNLGLFLKFESSMSSDTNRTIIVVLYTVFRIM